jgi:hypothetical protein
MEAADTRFSGLGIDFVKDPFALEYHIYNTTGERFFMKFNYQDHALISDSHSIMRMKWYVKDYEIVPPWRRKITVFDE